MTGIVERFQRIAYDPGSSSGQIEVHSGLSRHYPQLHGNLVAPLGGDTSVGLLEQAKRVGRIDDRVLSQLSQAAKHDATDLAFVVHRTVADFARVSAPVLVMSLLADQAAFASESRAMQRAAAGRSDLMELRGVNHYLVGQPEAAQAIAGRIRHRLVGPELTTEGTP